MHGERIRKSVGAAGLRRLKRMFSFYDSYAENLLLTRYDNQAE